MPQQIAYLSHHLNSHKDKIEHLVARSIYRDQRSCRISPSTVPENMEQDTCSEKIATVRNNMSTKHHPGVQSFGSVRSPSWQHNCNNHRRTGHDDISGNNGICEPNPETVRARHASSSSWPPRLVAERTESRTPTGAGAALDAAIAKVAPGMANHHRSKQPLLQLWKAWELGL
jgi:hypothetical protein